MNEFFDYHRALLADELRTRGYREAIRNVVKPGDVVLDLGAGSGVLSFFACDAGASRVYAIDQTHMADVIRFLARHLRLDDRVTVFHAESAEAELPERANVLVTETMGVSGFDEGILGHVLDARARLLRPNARIIPRALSLCVAPVEITEDYDSLIAWWSTRRYGLDLAQLRVFASNAMHLVHIEESAHLDDGVNAIDVELATFDSTVVRGSASFLASRRATLHGFATWFDATLIEDVSISNRGTRATHWSQGFLPLEKPIAVDRGTRIEVEIETDDGKSWQWSGSAGGTRFEQSTWFSMPPCNAI
ncbi:MAG TPA: 50S ribosomal protein L11 methyltransferase [Thermoanaerobaculia bacterium]|nr:50S ribosomal protein L11 methyltransferase [Thermoanaerobaculia bacterium]